MNIGVIMSTYNGERYLKEQLDSILKQKNVNIYITIRDDGSNDGTRQLLHKYSFLDNVNVIYGENIGYCRSFITALKSAPTADYYAFCDQDDYWFETKLESAVKKLSNHVDEPALYYSNLYIADEQLNILDKTHLENRVHSLESVFMRRSIAGCTMVLNDTLCEIVRSYSISYDMLRIGHDSFLVTLCYSLGGSVVCDANAYLKYRQHGRNTSGGAPVSFLKRVKKEYEAFHNMKNSDSDMAKAILKEFHNLDDKSIKILTEVAESPGAIKKRLKIVFSAVYVTGDIRLTLVGKIKVILGYL